MKLRTIKKPFTALVLLGIAQIGSGTCQIAEEAKKFDPVEIGFCEADAVFVGKVEMLIETMGGVTEGGSTQTKHFQTQHGTTKVLEQFKGQLPEKVTMVSELNYSTEAYAFESGKTYLIFATRRKAVNEYSAASAACSVQPTLLMDQAANVLKQLKLNKSGKKKIDCKNLRPRNDA